jgi:probable HAF family extracellular repeat protein
MQSKFSTCVVAITLFAIGGFTPLDAQQPQQAPPPGHIRYKLVVMGTFGGPQSASFFGQARSLNERGTLVGQADTSVPDRNFQNFNPLLGADPFIQHGFLWRDNRMTDLGALPGVNGSQVSWVNDAGNAVGISTTGNLDPVTGFPAANAVAWIDGHIINLGTLDGGYESLGIAINDEGEIAGISSNSTPDPISILGLGTQTRSFFWRDGAMQDIGTLGGPDAFALLINNRGQVAGISYENSLAVAPFVWERGEMRNLGNLGGTSGLPTWINNRGQIVGFSNLPGDTTTHPFLWTEAEGMKDLGTLGGTSGFANWINDSGEIVGASTNESGSLLAFVWKKGAMSSLGTLHGDPCSQAFNVNSTGQVVGSSVTDCSRDSGRAFLWDNGGPLIDLNTFVASGSGLTLTQGAYINDRGEILATGVLPNGDQRAVLLIPCDAAHSKIEGCD